MDVPNTNHIFSCRYSSQVKRNFSPKHLRNTEPQRLTKMAQWASHPHLVTVFLHTKFQLSEAIAKMEYNLNFKENG